MYVRVNRAPSAVLYDADFAFEFGKGYILRESCGSSHDRERRARRV